jgi:hypothetical protein
VGASPGHPLGDLGRALAGSGLELPEGHRWNLDVEVDSVEEGPRDPGAVALDQGNRAAAVVSPIS